MLPQVRAHYGPEKNAARAEEKVLKGWPVFDFLRVTLEFADPYVRPGTPIFAAENPDSKNEFCPRRLRSPVMY